jgi:small-conductance mechanosensitive channel
MRNLLERAFVEPFQRLAEQLGRVLPAIMTVVVILVVGGLVAHLIRWLCYKLLVVTHFDRLAAPTGVAGTLERTAVFRSPSDFAARLVQGIVWLFIILFALSATGTPMTDTLVMRFVNYVPDLITAGLVLLLGSVVSKFLARSALLAAVNAQWSGARLVSGVVRVLVMSLAVVIALEQLRIGRSALLVTFGLLFGGIVIAGSIAFGLGARDLARDWMRAKLRPRDAADNEEVLHHL